MADIHESIENDFSDYYEKTLAAERAKEVEAHLASCARCRAEYDKFREAVSALSGLHKMSAPQNFDRQVTSTIARRSAGRFFGQKAFGDRVPYEVLALVAIILAAAIVVLLRYSTTGTVHEPLEKEDPPAEVDPREVMPTP